MAYAQPRGRNASALKYDILTALGAYALGGNKHELRLVLRLITLLTARYNWTRNELAVGQREIARLWSVDERTVKRDMAKLRAKGWLVVKRQGARGHVTEYRLDQDRMLEDTRADWPKVGPDFELRMQGVPAHSNVVALTPKAHVAPPDLNTDPNANSEWDVAKAVLHQEDPAIYAAWVAALIRVDRAGGRVTLQAPSRFHGAYVQSHLSTTLLTAMRVVDDTVTAVTITV
ncbi:MAG: hypothetical protein AB8B71_20265 [Paracoccaceae bacterium]